MDREKGKEKSCSSHIVGSQHPEWLTWSQDYKHKISWKYKWHVAMTGGTFLSRPPGFPPKTYLQVGLKTPLTVFSFKSCFWDGQFSHCRHVKTRTGSGHIQIAAGGDPGLACPFSWLRHHVVGIMDPHSQPHVSTGWRDQRQNFNFLSKNAPCI
jgi:hypothetical protein